MKTMKYLLEESGRFPKPAHAHLSLSTLQKRIDTRYDKGICKGGSCYDCNNLSCKRDHDAEAWIMNNLFERFEAQLITSVTLNFFDRRL